MQGILSDVMLTEATTVRGGSQETSEQCLFVVCCCEAHHHARLLHDSRIISKCCSVLSKRAFTVFQPGMSRSHAVQDCLVGYNSSSCPTMRAQLTPMSREPSCAALSSAHRESLAEQESAQTTLTISIHYPLNPFTLVTRNEPCITPEGIYPSCTRMRYGIRNKKRAEANVVTHPLRVGSFTGPRHSSIITHRRAA